MGRDFLPRGTGIVTRRPLILQLVNVSNKSSDASSIHSGSESASPAPSGGEWGEFLHIPGRKFYDFSDIRREIESETSRIAGNNKGINRIPINLKIYSPHVLNLTLVDLPGLTKIPIGDQPTDIEKQTRTLISEYIAKPNSIILAVSPANVDLVNSESLKLARQVDPQGKRTIGVLTKLDLMDQGTNALDILSGHVYPLKLGFVGVINRSQQDIQENRPMSESLEHEKQFFLNHPAYRNIAHKCGTQYLAKSLNQTLMTHIRDRLPDIKARLNTLMGQTEQELASYGNENLFNKEARGPLLLQLMTKFASSFTASIDGNSSNISTKELSGGARVYYIYNQVFGSSLKSIDPVANLSNSDIRTAIRNSTGPRPSLFVPELAFDLLVKPQIKLLEAPSQKCVEMVYEELMKICHNSSSPELARFPKLQTKLIEVISDLLRERLGPSSSYVSSLIDIQMAYINTNHPNFLGAATAMSNILSERQAKERRIREELLAEKRHEEAVNSGGDVDLTGSKEEHAKEAANAALNGSVKKTKASSHADAHHRVSSHGSNGPSKDSFLNYFFGKDAANLDAAGLASEFHHESQVSYPTGSYKMNDLSHELENLEGLSEKEVLECELIRKLITSYFGIVRETIEDQVPKAVMHLLVNHSKESAQNRLVSELYKESLFDELLYEDENLAQERAKCAEMLKTYREASKVISEVI